MTAAIQAIGTRPYSPRRYSRDEYYRMADLGFFDGQRVELIDGEVVEMSPVKPAHATAVTLVRQALDRAFGRGYVVRVQDPLSLAAGTPGDTEPLPDIAVVRGTARDYATAHPTTALLVVEVAEGSLQYDRTMKSGLYARAGISDYWVLDLVARCLEVHREPTEMPGQPFGAAYRSVHLYLPEEDVSPLERPDARIRVSNLLP